MTPIVAILGGVRATVFAGLAAAALLWGGWQFLGKEAATKALMEERLAQIKEDAATTKQMADLYESKVEAVNAVSKQAEIERNEQKAKYESTIADLRAKRIVVRERFTCPANSAKESADPSAPSGTQEGGLHGEDVEFLLSEAERADQVVNDYNELLKIMEAMLKNDKPKE